MANSFLSSVPLLYKLGIWAFRKARFEEEHQRRVGAEHKLEDTAAKYTELQKRIGNLTDDLSREQAQVQPWKVSTFLPWYLAESDQYCPLQWPRLEYHFLPLIFVTVKEPSHACTALRHGHLMFTGLKSHLRHVSQPRLWESMMRQGIRAWRLFFTLGDATPIKILPPHSCFPVRPHHCNASVFYQVMNTTSWNLTKLWELLLRSR